MTKYQRDDYWHGYRNLKLTDSQARALETVLAIVLNDPTWPFTNSGEQRALSNTLTNLHLIMMKRDMGALVLNQPPDGTRGPFSNSGP